MLAAKELKITNWRYPMLKESWKPSFQAIAIVATQSEIAIWILQWQKMRFECVFLWRMERKSKRVFSVKIWLTALSNSFLPTALCRARRVLIKESCLHIFQVLCLPFQRLKEWTTMRSVYAAHNCQKAEEIIMLKHLHFPLRNICYCRTQQLQDSPKHLSLATPSLTQLC